LSCVCYVYTKVLRTTFQTHLQQRPQLLLQGVQPLLGLLGCPATRAVFNLCGLQLICQPAQLSSKALLRGLVLRRVRGLRIRQQCTAAAQAPHGASDDEKPAFGRSAVKQAWHCTFITSVKTQEGVQRGAGSSIALSSSTSRGINSKVLLGPLVLR
jgi:hypothetical protein